MIKGIAAAFGITYSDNAQQPPGIWSSFANVLIQGLCEIVIANCSGCYKTSCTKRLSMDQNWRL